MKPKVAIWMITYNQEAYIEQAILSVVNQKTTFPFILVVGDDASSDRTQEIIKGLSNQYPDIIHPILRTRNKLVENARSVYDACFDSGADYIALLEGDDYWCDPHKLQKQVDFLEENEDFVGVHTWQKMTAIKDGNDAFEEFVAPRKDSAGYNSKVTTDVGNVFRNEVRLKTRTVMYRTVFRLPDWFYSIPYGDVTLSMIAGKYGKFHFIDEETSVYRITGGGLSASVRGTDEQFAQSRLNWIKVWDKGNEYNEGKYSKECYKTMCFFYDQAKKRLGKEHKEILRGIKKYIVEESSLPVNLKRKFKLRSAF